MRGMVVGEGGRSSGVLLYYFVSALPKPWGTGVEAISIHSEDFFHKFVIMNEAIRRPALRIRRAALRIGSRCHISLFAKSDVYS